MSRRERVVRLDPLVSGFPMPTRTEPTYESRRITHYQHDTNHATVSSQHNTSSTHTLRGGPGNTIDGSPKGRKSEGHKSGNIGAVLRLRCPYYVHDPDACKGRRACGGSGWPDVARVK